MLACLRLSHVTSKGACPWPWTLNPYTFLYNPLLSLCADC
jgi:hypothetical protein